MESNKRVLITGANGFIGSHIAEFFFKQGFTLYGFVQPGTSLEKLEGIPIQIFYGDITQPETLDLVFQQVRLDIVIHNAGLASDWGSLSWFRSVNVEGTKNVAKKALEYKVRRMLLISSTAIHGFENKGLIREEMPPNPPNNYAISKLEAEQWFMNTPELQGLEVTAIRPGNVFGTRDHTFISHYLDLLSKGLGGYIAGGHSKTCPVYVENLAYGIFLAATSPHAVKQSFIITDGLDIDWRGFTEKLCDSLGAKKPFVSIPYYLALYVAKGLEFFYRIFQIKKAPFLTKYRVYNGGRDYAFSIEKAHRVLNYQPLISLDEAVSKTVTWYQQSKK